MHLYCLKPQISLGFSLFEQGITNLRELNPLSRLKEHQQKNR